MHISLLIGIILKYFKNDKELTKEELKRKKSIELYEKYDKIQHELKQVLTRLDLLAGIISNFAELN